MRAAQWVGFAVTMCLALTAALEPGLVSAQSRTPDKAPPTLGAPPETNIRLAPYLSFGAKLEIEFELRRNFDLSDREHDDLHLLTPELSLAFSFDPSRSFRAFLNVELSREFVLSGREDRDERVVLELKEAFVWFKELLDPALSIQIGRQEFKDGREWLYDEELDAVRLHYGAGRFGVELSVSRNGLVRKDLLAKDHDGERINNYLLYGRYRPTEKLEIGAYGLVRDDRSNERESPIFFGVRSSGEIVRHLDHWLELAHVRGRDGSRRIRGIGLDVGLTYELGLPLRPSLTAGYAFGSGDADPGSRMDRSFRQTGLQENEGRFNGVTKFKYYGELFDPELSNLSILTHGIGIRPTRHSSIDLVHHYYLQHRAADSIRDARIDHQPAGRHRGLGHEIDLIVGYREIRTIDMKLVLAWFSPGRAFPADADSAFFAGFEIEFKLP